MTVEAGTVLGRYKISSPLGTGGMGEVYLAEDTQLARAVAIKILPASIAPESHRMRRFIQEARTASALNHPNILTIYEIGQSDNIHFIATEFIDGQTVRQLINAGPMNAEEVVDIGRQVASALVAAHAAGIIHRDVKPENIMVRPDGYVKVLDFGLAKLTERQGVTSDEAVTIINTEPGVVMGTANYMSPEQARGLELDCRTDLWSLGAVLYEMLNAHPAFRGATVSDVLVGILEKPAPPMSETSGNLSRLIRVINKSLIKDRKRRYQTAQELLNDLDEARRDLNPDASNEATRPLPPISRLSAKRRALPFAVAVVLILAVAILLGWQRLWPNRTPANDRVTLAVLPFRPLNAQQEIGFLGVGIPDSIITRLSSIRQVRLRPTSAVLRYENQNVDAQQVGRELGSDYLVTGTVQKVEDHLRVTVQLIQSRNGEPLWGSHYDRPRSDLIDVQDSIAEQIASALKIRMSAAEQAQVYRRYTQNTLAYEWYLRGRSQLARSTKEATLASVEAFDSALRLDSSYTLARSGLAMACADMHLYFAPAGEVLSWGERAKREAQWALEQDANLAETHLALAAVYGKTEFDWDRTIAESQRALELNPNMDLPHYLRARALYHLGLFEAADNDLREGFEINPGTASENQFEGLRTKGNTAMLNGRFAEAVAALEEAHRLSEGPVSDWWLAQAYYYQGQKERSEKLLETLVASPSASAVARSQAILASFLAARGERVRAQELVRAVEAAGYMDHHVAYSLGVAHANLGQHEDAVRWLRTSAETGFPSYPWFERDPLLEPLRKDAGFQQFMSELQKTFEIAKTRYSS
jgi:serine/threonine protein kinase/Flp pilus assembly protein TadD